MAISIISCKVPDRHLHSDRTGTQQSATNSGAKVAGRAMWRVSCKHLGQWEQLRGLGERFLLQDYVLTLVPWLHWAPQILWTSCSKPRCSVFSPYAPHWVCGFTDRDGIDLRSLSPGTEKKLRRAMPPKVPQVSWLPGIISCVCFPTTIGSDGEATTWEALGIQRWMKHCLYSMGCDPSCRPRDRA